MAWICWGCNITGNTLELIAAFEKCSIMDAIGYVVDGYVGGDAPVELSVVAKPMAASRTGLSVLPTVPYPNGYEQIVTNMPAHQEAVHYLARRGIGHSTIAEYRIGYCRFGPMTRYVVFPCFMDGGLVYWQARATWDPPKFSHKDQRKAWEKATKYRKTLNPMGGPVEAMEVLFNYDRARAERHVVICEGPIDAIKVGPHAVALLGKEPSPTKVERLLRMSAARYTVYLDPGEKERAKALALAEQLHEWAPTFIATPPHGCDPGDLTPGQNHAIIAQAEPYAPVGLQSKLKLL